MPLIGGGGAPNVSGGANPAGVGSSINYIEEHAYAFSGGFSASTSSQTMLDFSTGTSYIVGTITCNGGTEIGTPGNGNVSSWNLTFDDQSVAVLLTETETEDMPATNQIKILIPPFTRVELKMLSSADDANSLHTALITGRVYA